MFSINFTIFWYFILSTDTSFPDNWSLLIICRLFSSDIFLSLGISDGGAYVSSISVLADWFGFFVAAFVTFSVNFYRAISPVASSVLFIAYLREPYCHLLPIWFCYQKAFDHTQSLIFCPCFLQTIEIHILYIDSITDSNWISHYIRQSLITEI